MAEFNTAEFWPGEVYLDNDHAFFAAVGGGKVNSLSLTQLLNPFGAAMKNMSRAGKTVKKSNFAGEGTKGGGLLVLSPSKSEVVYAFMEKVRWRGAGVRSSSPNREA